MIQDALVAFMEANETLQATFGRRVYPVVLPDRCVFPAIIYTVLSIPAEHTMEGSAGDTEARVQLTAYADSYGAAWQASAVLRGELDAKSGTWGVLRIGACLLEDQGDAPALVAEDESAVVWGVRQEYSIQFGPE